MYPEVNYKWLRNISDQIIPDNAVLHLLALSYIRDLLYSMFAYSLESFENSHITHLAIITHNKRCEFIVRVGGAIVLF